MSLRPSNHHDTLSEDLELTIRFSASLPDLHLTIPLSTQPDANTSTLKQTIRSHLPSDHASRRIRLIYSGKALADDAPLATTLRRPPLSSSHPPSRTSTPRPGSAPAPPATTGNGDVSSSSKQLKGKAPIRSPLAPPAQRIYIHCSIGDVILTPPELAQEAQLAAPSIKRPSSSTFDGSKERDGDQDATILPTKEHSIPAPPPPRGFDRLLTTGFTATEVSALRMQFLAIQAHTHTPDDMPSPNTMRDMEDQWLDNSDAATITGGAGTADGGGEGSPMLQQSNEDSEGGALDDMIYGTAMGFFWPLGCMMWAYRESGIWSARRRMAVVVGVVLNVGMGFVRFAK